MTGVIDTHAHVAPDKFAPVEELERAMTGAGVARAVLIQHIGGDNAYLLNAVRRDPDQFAAAMWVDPSHGDLEDEIVRVHGGGGFRGIRLFVETLADHPGSWEVAAGLGLNLVVSFMELGLHDVHDRLLALVRAYPDCPVILTRFGLAMGQSLDAVPFGLLSILADQRNVYLEVSPFPDRSTGAATPGVDAVVAELTGIFGPERVTFGSGFPARDTGGVVADPAEAYGADLTMLLDGALGVASGDQRQVLWQTPHALWFA